MPRTLGVILDRRALEGFIGREKELALLRSLLTSDGPRVVHVSGVTGIGKSSLLDAFVAEARQAGATVVRVDCRTVEPTVPGLLGALAAGTGAGRPTVEQVTERLAALACPVVIAFDGYELLGLLDTFIRRELCPRLPDSVGLILAGRTGPVGAWLSAPEWRGLFRALRLGPLTEREAFGYLEQLGVERDAARRINAVARGHPLALAVAARLGTGPAPARAEDAAMGAVIDLVTQDYLATATEPSTREALEAGSVVRRVTESLLRAMLPDTAPADVMDRLRALPFVDTAADGLFIHDGVRDAVSTGLTASDPERHRRYRVAAWHQLRRDLAHSTPATIWRYTADILYLLQNYIVREAFFPSGHQSLAVEPALPADASTIREIARCHEGPEASAAVAAWWTHHPESVRVCRDAEGQTAGIFLVMKGSDISEEITSADPVAAAWAAEMQAGEHASQSLLLRRGLDVREGEANSGSRGAFAVDVKRTYMEMRPGLRYIYLCGVDPIQFDWCLPLGFEEVPALARTLDDRVYHTFRLNMGPGSVDAWLGRVVADELGIPLEDRIAPPFDPDAQELLVEGTPVALTPLELGVMRALHGRAGRPVSEADLVEEVWGYETAATSNVVAAVIVTLRRKLGPRASVIETVRGVGYRYRP